MKKNIYILVGTLALVCAFFLGAFYIYQKANKHPDPGVLEDSALIRDWSPSQGPLMARIKVVEFLDPACEACGRMHPIVKKILKDYEGRLHYVLRYMPLHTNSVLAATWLEAAKEQNKFWEALDVVFAQQSQWADHANPKPELLATLLNSVGVDLKLAEVARAKLEITEHIQKDKEDGSRLGVNGTPTFFVNGRMLPELGEAPLRKMIDEALHGGNL